MATTSKVESSRPVGPKVANTAPALRPQGVTMNGQFITLVPLSLDHADDLFDALGGQKNAAVWDYIPDDPFDDREVFRNYIAKLAQQSDDRIFFTVIDKATSRAIGFAALLRIEPVNRVIEVGFLVFSLQLQKTAGATECIYLLARNIFDDLGYRRLEWKCNNLNEPSKRAAKRFGFTFEGLFRQHMIVKGRNRDSAWFSMLDSEWPAVKQALEAWLDPSNFDEEGQQRSRLASLRE